jgi:hypothetical protein
MNTMRKLRVSLVWLIFMGVGACAKGAPAEVPDLPEPPPDIVVPTCGNGKMDMGEDCECMNKETTGLCVANMTCDIVTPGDKGMLLCDSKTCKFDTSMCNSHPAGSAGTGGGAGAGK